MKKRIKEYLNRINTYLSEEKSQAEWEAIIKEHLVQVGFFQHERLIHLLVTLTVAVITFIVGVSMFFIESIIPVILLLLLLSLLIPYIMHYYTLENGVQEMYRQYDELLGKLKTD